MDVYRTEEEQVEAIRRWWQKNGSGILIAIVLAIAIVLGWQTWQQSQETGKQSASIAFGQVVEASQVLTQARLGADAEAETQDEALTSARATFNSLLEQIRNDNAGSEYASLASLIAAQQTVLDSDYAAAAEHLRWVIEHSANAAITVTATLRLARVLAASEAYADALATLDSVDAGVQLDAFEEVRGDILLAQGERDKARAAYERALEASEVNQGSARPILKFKRDNLLVVQPS